MATRLDGIGRLAYTNMGKVFVFLEKPQWAVVGDTFQLGALIPTRSCILNSSALNPDSTNSTYNTKFGVYSPNCGLRNVTMSWGQRRIYLSNGKGLCPRAGIVHASLSFVLCSNTVSTAYQSFDGRSRS
jgi:hypothetical protein